MNPKEFNWTADQQVVVINPTSKAFRFQVHSKWYEVPAGKTVKMPGFIAWSYVYKLAVEMAVAAKDFDKWNEDGVHQEYYDKVVVSVEEIIQQVVEAEKDVTTFDDEETDPDSSAGEDESDEETEDDERIEPMKQKRGRPSKK